MVIAATDGSSLPPADQRVGRMRSPAIVISPRRRRFIYEPGCNTQREAPSSDHSRAVEIAPGHSFVVQPQVHIFYGRLSCCGQISAL